MDYDKKIEMCKHAVVFLHYVRARGKHWNQYFDKSKFKG